MGQAIKIVAVIFTVAIAVAIALWNKIMQWAEEDLFPWIKTNLSPKVEKLTREAFVRFDKVAVPVRQIAKKAWRTLRKFLLEAVVKFERKVDRKWLKKWTTKIIKFLEVDGKNKAFIKKREYEYEIEYDDLPADVRESSIRSNRYNYQVDFTDTRDKEVMTITN